MPTETEDYARRANFTTAFYILAGLQSPKNKSIPAKLVQSSEKEAEENLPVPVILVTQQTTSFSHQKAQAPAGFILPLLFSGHHEITT